MPDDEVQPEPILYTRIVALVVERWPERIEVSQEYLRKPHVHKARFDGDTLTITAHNGVGVYMLRRDLPKRPGGALLADLQSGDTPSRLKQRGAKYKTPVVEEGAT